MFKMPPAKVDIAIAGGSIAGLCAGVALRFAGFDAYIFERSKSRLSSRGAGIVVQPELLGLLGSVKAPHLSITSCTHRRYVDADTGNFQDAHMPQDFTSWEAIFTSLREAFPDDCYLTDAPVSIADQTDNRVSLKIGGSETEAAILVGADGFRSELRARFAPDTITRYAGYVAWRGVLDESAAPDALADFFHDRFSFCNAADGGHALCYLIPGDALETARGKRRLNWVWYVTVDDGPAMDAIMTDRSGARRDAAVPAGEVRSEVLEDLRAQAARLSPQFADLVRATPDPFIQAIFDIAPSRMVSGRVCLIGDAAFVVRPHTAAAAAKAAADAAALARVLRGTAPDIGRGLKVWEEQQMATGRNLVNYGVMLGERSQKEGAR